MGNDEKRSRTTDVDSEAITINSFDGAIYDVNKNLCRQSDTLFFSKLLDHISH